jgi:hypothetical protein
MGKQRMMLSILTGRVAFSPHLSTRTVNTPLLAGEHFVQVPYTG